MGKSKIFEIRPPKGEETPFWWQRETILKWMKCRFLSLFVSRQHGKSRLGREVLADFLFRYRKRHSPRAAVVMTTANQAYAVYFAHLDEILENLPPGIYTKQGSLGSSLRITIKRVWLEEPDYITVDIVGAGNPKALRGQTYDLVIADEAAFWNGDIWFDILESTLDAPNGLALLTSTLNGRDNWFFQNHQNHKKMKAEGFTLADSLEFDVYTAQLRSDEWIEAKRRYYEGAGKIESYEQEMLCNPDAKISPAESPFARRIVECMKDVEKPNTILSNPVSTIYACVDLGTRNNNPVWEFVPNAHEGVLFLGYEDNDESQYKMIDRLVKKYDTGKIVLILPNDALQPSVMEGITRIALLKRYIDKMKYSRRITLRVLEKTKNRVEMVKSGVELLAHSKFWVSKCMKGMEKLRLTRMKKESVTGHISPKEFARNGAQHAGDALCYVAAALISGYTYDANTLGGVDPSESSGEAVDLHYYGNKKYKY